MGVMGQISHDPINKAGPYKNTRGIMETPIQIFTFIFNSMHKYMSLSIAYTCTYYNTETNLG